MAGRRAGAGPRACSAGRRPRRARHAPDAGHEPQRPGTRHRRRRNGGLGKPRHPPLPRRPLRPGPVLVGRPGRALAVGSVAGLGQRLPAGFPERRLLGPLSDPRAPARLAGDRALHRQHRRASGAAGPRARGPGLPAGGRADPGRHSGGRPALSPVRDGHRPPRGPQRRGLVRAAARPAGLPAARDDPVRRAEGPPGPRRKRKVRRPPASP